MILVREILSFYKENALFHSSNNYDEKFLSLEFFYSFDEITIEVINQYCALSAHLAIDFIQWFCALYFLMPCFK